MIWFLPFVANFFLASVLAIELDTQIASKYIGTDIGSGDGRGVKYLSGGDKVIAGGFYTYYESYEGEVAAPGNSFIIQRYGSDGTLKWTRIWGDGRPTVADMTVDPQDNIYVAGHCSNSFGTFTARESDFCFVKYDADGNFQFAKMVGGSGVEELHAITVSDTNIHLFGITYGNNFDGKAPSLTARVNTVYAKYSSTGTLLASNFLSYFQPTYTYGASVDSNNNIYITGMTIENPMDGYSFSSGGYNGFISKYDKDFNLQWSRLYGPEISNDHQLNNLFIDSNNNIYGVGKAAFDDLTTMVVKVDATGNSLLTFYSNSTGYKESGEAITVDETTQKIYVTGKAYYPTWESSPYYMIYDSQGHVLSSNFLPQSSQGNYGDCSYGIAVKNNKVDIVGIFANSMFDWTFSFPQPSQAPTEAPTLAPSEAPTLAPTEAPTQAPTEAPTEAPTQAPTEAPTLAPTTPGSFVDKKLTFTTSFSIFPLRKPLSQPSLDALVKTFALMTRSDESQTVMTSGIFLFRSRYPKMQIALQTSVWLSNYSSLSYDNTNDLFNYLNNKLNGAVYNDAKLFMNQYFAELSSIHTEDEVYLPMNGENSGTSITYLKVNAIDEGSNDETTSDKQHKNLSRAQVGFLTAFLIFGVLICSPLVYYLVKRWDTQVKEERELENQKIQELTTPQVYSTNSV